MGDGNIRALPRIPHCRILAVAGLIPLQVVCASSATVLGPTEPQVWRQRWSTRWRYKKLSCQRESKPPREKSISRCLKSEVGWEKRDCRCQMGLKQPATSTVLICSRCIYKYCARDFKGCNLYTRFNTQELEKHTLQPPSATGLNSYRLPSLISLPVSHHSQKNYS